MRRITITAFGAVFAFAAAITLLAATENTPSTESGNRHNVASAMLRASPLADTLSATAIQKSSSANYTLDWYSINSGAAVDAASPSYRLDVGVGQALAGEASSPSYEMGIGFSFGTSGGCICPCKYDPECDGVISDVLDVTRTINVAFRGQPTVQDPGCPRERSDVDASGATDVLDVTKVINVAFRGQSVATNYVDPCAP